MPDAIIINHRLHIPIAEAEFRFARSGGKGGQNVNKVETRVELLFDVAHSPSLTSHEREQLLKALQSRLDKGGILRIVAQESRSQWRNREDALKRFTGILQRALRERKKRIPTKTTLVGKQKRLDQKKKRSEIKRMRRMSEE